MKIYPLWDYPRRADLEHLKIDWSELTTMQIIGLKNNKIKAIKTGEFREPKKGEWYLSGAIVEAYRAPNNLSTKFHIAKLVLTETKTVTTTTIISK